MFFDKVGKLIFWPLRAIAKVFRGTARASAKSNAGSGVSAAKTAVQTSGALAANLSATEIVAENPLEIEYQNDPPSGLEAAIFKQLPRPRLVEQAASELTVEQAREFASQAEQFYEFDFPLFSRGDFFYEEIEQQYLQVALGYDEDSVDRRFMDVTALFRRTLNDNTRRLLLCWTPLLGAIALFLGGAAIHSGFRVPGIENDVASFGAVYGAAVIVAGLIAFLIYSWPYKVVQQRNLMNLDNYITSKFGRINHNFQVAKRRALNVEREKRMSERDALKDEAGAWTLAYHWFATRLFLCESLLRNKFYQIRRNTALYWVGGLVLTIALFVGEGAALAWMGGPMTELMAFAGAAAVYLIVVGTIMGCATPMMLYVLQSNEWSRFNLIRLNHTISDHVGEDKIQIVTFRDRNRFE